MADLLHTAQLLVVVFLCALACAAALGRHVALLEYLRRAVVLSGRAGVAAATLGRVRVASETRRRMNRTRRRARAMNAKRHAADDEVPTGDQTRSGWTGPRAARPSAPVAPPAEPPISVAVRPPAAPESGEDEPPQAPPMIGPPAP